jgi:hypothetical protein
MSDTFEIELERHKAITRRRRNLSKHAITFPISSRTHGNTILIRMTARTTAMRRRRRNQAVKSASAVSWRSW